MHKPRAAGAYEARAYSVVTGWQADTSGQWYRAFEIWKVALGERDDPAARPSDAF
jgi:hypothetical protein